MSPFGEGAAPDMAKRRWVTCHLTPVAPGMGQLGIDSPKRWVEQFAVTPKDSLADLLRTSIGCGPHDVEVRLLIGGDIGVIKMTGQYRTYPFAYIFAGLLLEEAQAALELLRAEQGAAGRSAA